MPTPSLTICIGPRAFEGAILFGRSCLPANRDPSGRHRGHPRASPQTRRIRRSHWSPHRADRLSALRPRRDPGLIGSSNAPGGLERRPEMDGREVSRPVAQGPGGTSRSSPRSTARPSGSPRSPNKAYGRRGSRTSTPPSRIAPRFRAGHGRQKLALLCPSPACGGGWGGGSRYRHPDRHPSPLRLAVVRERAGRALAAQAGARPRERLQS